MSWQDWDAEEDTMRGDRLALLCLALLLLAFLVSMVQSVALLAGH